MADLQYDRRPSASPAVAALIASGSITAAHRVLDICCGEGEDSLLLATGGVTHVIGIDEYAAGIKRAKKRAKELGVSDNVKFRNADLFKVLSGMRAGSCDVVIDTLASRT